MTGYSENKRRTLLLVDDAEEDRERYRRWLHRDPDGPYQCHDAGAGRTGLALCQALRPDCILLDFRLPDMNGLEFVEQLQSLMAADMPAVIMLTGMGTEAVAVEAMKQGVMDYLSKSVVSQQTLTRAVNQALETVQLRRMIAQQQQQLRDREELLRMLSERLPDGVVFQFALEPDGRQHFPYLSTQIVNLTGVRADETMSDAAVLHERLTPLSYDQLMTVMHTSAQDLTPVDIEVCRQLPSGEIRWGHIRSHPRRLPTGTTVWDGVEFDITTRKQAEAERERLLTELQRVNAELQQFAYIVSHDLHEPLRTIGNFTQFLQKRFAGVIDAEAKEDMTLIVEAAQRMQQMLTDLLAYTRVDGQQHTQTAVNYEAVLTQVLRDLQLIIGELQAQVTHDPLPTVYGDATRLKQVLQNLISNALKFRSAAPPRIHVSARRDGARWCVSVRDNGIGINPSQHERIFQIFQRLHTRSEYTGTGIGLAISKKIIEQHGGRIWVESTPGAGSTFFFTLAASA